MIYTTQPSIPPLNDFIPYLKKIWENKWLTNNGSFHNELEEELCKFLGVEYISLTANGTLALITALQALRIGGEVITTPYSFVASTHSIWWNNIKPIFVDIEKDSFNLDPKKIEAAITPQTTAILPVHVYGIPCNVEEIQQIADTYNLKIIYDSAHAFGVNCQNKSILNFGDLSVLSFHATKIYNTIEGGAIICKDSKMKRHIDDLKNFGFRDEVTVVAPGINAKMNELQAAYGLLALKSVRSDIQKRKKITELYIEKLDGTKGISFCHGLKDNIDYNYAYFPILVDEKLFGQKRDVLYNTLKENNVYSRRYFYPLISNLPTYRGLPSANKSNLPNANKKSDQILCLPIYPNLDMTDVERICKIIKQCTN